MRKEIIFITATLLSSCSIAVPDVPQGGPVCVGFSIGESLTKACVDSDGIGVSWEKGDEVALWARNSGGSYTLSDRSFKIMARYASGAVFTATLDSPMAEDTYYYTVCYPLPLSVDNTKLKFNIPATQDGVAGGGADIMVSDVAKGGPLKTYGEEGGLTLSMNHLVHLLKFYLPKGSNGLNGENVRRIEFSFPAEIAGDVCVDISDPTGFTEFENRSKAMVLKSLDLAPSGSSKVYACAAIYPASAVNGELNITLYSDSYMSELAPVAVSGRNFVPGHCTAVPLKVADVRPCYTINYSLGENNLGEEIQKITFTAPDGCTWGDGLGNVFVCQPGGNIPLGYNGMFKYTDRNAYMAMSGKTISVTYDSEHAESVQTFTLPDLSSRVSASLDLKVPYLLFEDFSSVPSFSSNDKYSMSSLGSMDPYSFLNGWSGGRVGGSAGASIRIAGRRECGLFVDAHYPARVESAPLSKLKKAATVTVEFDYGCDREYTSSPASGDIGQNVWVGYVTSTTQYSSGDTDGTYPVEFSSDDKGDSWTSLPNHFSTQMTLPEGSSNRISWRNDPKDLSNFGSNTTSWFYIDNVKVKIAN